jgi:hypothetical protein
MKKNPQFPINKRMIDSFEDYGGASSKLIGWLEIPIEAFLYLTTKTDVHLNQIVSSSKSRISLSKAKEMIIPPFLSISPSGQIMSHEGRHRSASAMKTGEKKQIIALLGSETMYAREANIHGHNYWYKDIPFPKTLVGQFGAHKKFFIDGLRFKRRWAEPWEKINMKKIKPKKKINPKKKSKQNPDEIREELSWVDAVANHADPEQRREIAKENVEALKYYQTRDGRPTREGMTLYRRFSDKRKFRLVGILTNIRYLQVEECQGEMEPRYIHPGGSVTLMFLELTPGGKYKYNPVIQIVNVNIRYNESVLNEIDGNEYTGDMRGFTF